MKYVMNLGRAVFMKILGVLLSVSFLSTCVGEGIWFLGFLSMSESDVPVFAHAYLKANEEELRKSGFHRYKRDGSTHLRYAN